jgi:hypothetical protein
MPDLSTTRKTEIKVRFLFMMLATCFHATFELSLCFDPEDGGDMFFRNVG